MSNNIYAADEDDPCPDPLCPGVLVFQRPANCVGCHPQAMCGACVEAPLVCDYCGEQA